MAKHKLPPVVDDDDDDGPDPHDFVFTPPPKTSMLTAILCVLNGLAALAFFYCLLLNMQKRQEWTRAVFLQNTVPDGLPLEEEDKRLTVSQAIKTKPKLRSEDLRAVYQERKSGGTVTQPFIVVQDVPPIRITPRLLTRDNLKDIFGEHQPVTTLEEEIRRVKDAVFQDLDAAVKEIVAADADKSADDKRAHLVKVLLPQANNVIRTRELDNQIRTAAESDLDGMLAEAVEKRMILDILEPVEFTRPGRVAEIDVLSLKDLQDKLRKRLENASEDKYLGELTIGKDWKERDSVEKRYNIVYLLFAIAHVTRPDGKLLYEKGPARVQIVAGVEDFNWAAEEFNRALTRLYGAVVERITLEREGVPFPKDEGLQRSGGFVQKHQEMIDKVRAQFDKIAAAEQALKRKQKQRDQARQLFGDREKERQDRATELIILRGKTAQLLQELQGMQRRLFAAQLELADAAKINEELEKEIRAWERERFRLEGLLIEKGRKP